LTATNLAQVPSGKASANAPSKKSSSKKGAADDDGGMGICGIFGDVTASATGDNAAKGDKTADSTSEWTDEQDKKLMEMKGDNRSWRDIATEVSKDERQCKERFRQIKPKDWKPNNVKGGGVVGKQNQDKQKGGKSQQENEKKDDTSSTGANAFADNTGWGATGADGGFQDSSNGGWGGDETSGEKKDNNAWGGADTGFGENKDTEGFKVDDIGWGGDTPGSGNNKGTEGFKVDDNAWRGGENSGGNGVTDGWGNENGAADAGTSWDNNNDTNNDNDNDNNSTNNFSTINENPGGDTLGGWNNDASSPNNNGATNLWPAAPNSPAKNSSNTGSKTPSKKSASHSESKHRRLTREPERPKATATAPPEYELRPDSTFSADDLRLVAKILQQDCHMVWNRVSWRFKDKTGRTLHPEVFEKKITGKVEGKGSERGRR
jgi:hypothetical protein